MCMLFCFVFSVMYSNYAGGVSAISNFNFHAVNGFSNDYWGWGSEDDDFSARFVRDLCAGGCCTLYMYIPVY